MLNELEQIIVALIEEGRYSYQLRRATKLLSSEMNVSFKILDGSKNSLKIIDNYLNSSIGDKKISMEIALAITLYFSQMIVSLCDGVWEIEDEILFSSNEVSGLNDKMLLFCTARIEFSKSNVVVAPHQIVVSNLLKVNSNSNLEQVLNSLIEEVEIEARENNADSKYLLDELDNLIFEGHDFLSEVPSLISFLSTEFKIPIKKLNKSVNSLNLIDKMIRNSKVNLVHERENFDSKLFLALLVYIGEVIIEAVHGKWKLNAEKFRLQLGSQYHWTIKIFDSEGRELKQLISSIHRSLYKNSYVYSNIKKIVDYYICANQENDECIWLNNEESIDRKKRLWRRSSTE